jgi:hypothetical protein
MRLINIMYLGIYFKIMPPQNVKKMTRAIISRSRRDIPVYYNVLAEGRIFCMKRISEKVIFYKRDTRIKLHSSLKNLSRTGLPPLRRGKVYCAPYITFAPPVNCAYVGGMQRCHLLLRERTTGPEDAYRCEKRPQANASENWARIPLTGECVLGRDWPTEENAFRERLGGFSSPEEGQPPPTGRGRVRQFGRRSVGCRGPRSLLLMSRSAPLAQAAARCRFPLPQRDAVYPDAPPVEEICRTYAQIKGPTTTSTPDWARRTQDLLRARIVFISVDSIWGGTSPTMEGLSQTIIIESHGLVVHNYCYCY